jgi:hypothetical protein
VVLKYFVTGSFGFSDGSGHVKVDVDDTIFDVVFGSSVDVFRVLLEIVGAVVVVVLVLVVLLVVVVEVVLVLLLADVLLVVVVVVLILVVVLVVVMVVVVVVVILVVVDMLIAVAVLVVVMAMVVIVVLVAIRSSSLLIVMSGNFDVVVNIEVEAVMVGVESIADDENTFCVTFGFLVEASVSVIRGIVDETTGIISFIAVLEVGASDDF